MIGRIFNRLSPDVGKSNKEHREEWLKKVLKSIPAGSRILDAGAGTQRYKSFCGHLDYVSQDFAAYDGIGDGSGIQKGSFNYGELDIISDISSIPEQDGSFDAVMCIEVIEHVPDPLPAIHEFSRLLKGGGVLLISAPFCSLTHFAPFHYSSGFNRYWYEKHLKDNGFEIVELLPNGNYFEYMAQEIQRLNSVANRYGNSGFGITSWIASYFLLRSLLKSSKADNGSDELLCYGYEVIARKI
jgi:SAM-dependent methyltransferase